ncbi:MFS transporter [Beduini massiliensis]|uniref:MFS transporter n=1 Tax=Beduini massiliensis TaxID=1585974 RepID=UPI00059A7E4F|nr:MFS transporter [Beduini massiliensis]
MNHLKNWKKNIIRFLTAQTISLLGSSIVQYSIIWYITISTSSGSMLTIATVCGFLPQVIISLFAGVWIDRYDRKKMIILSDLMIAIMTLILAVSFLSGYKNLWLLFIVLIVRSFGTGIQTPAVNAIIPQIVPNEQLMRINGINSTLSSLMMFVSPAVSGAVLSILSLEATLFIDIITAIVGIGITLTIKLQSYQRKDKIDNSYLKEIKEGFTYLKENRFIKRLLMFQILILFLISPSAFLTPLMVNRTFGPQVWRLTASEMTYSLGMVIGGLLFTTWGGFKKKMNTTLLAGGLYGMIMIGLGLAPYFLLYLLLNMTIGITSPCYNAPITVTIQEKVDASMHGRIFSLMQISTSCALPLGMVIFGPVADYIAIQWLLIGAGSIVLLLSLYVYLSHYFEIN